MTNPAPVATILAVSIHRTDTNPVHGRGTLQISIDDEGAGYFIKICELGDDLEQYVRIDADELELVFQEARKLIAQKTLLTFKDLI
jgi:hypothetical protein